jgi:transcriptional regulator with XRE-family HTH domain
MGNAYSNDDSEQVASLITNRQAELGLSDEELAAALGYTNERVIALLKAGTMRVPVKVVTGLATALKVDSFHLLRLVLSESSPALWKAIEEVVAPLGELTATEVNLLRHLRRLGRDRQMRSVVFDGRDVVALVAVE